MSQFVDESSHDKSLRLGDVISGFAHIVPSFTDFFAKGNEYTLDIKPKIWFVVLTPCCSIEDKTITVVPFSFIFLFFHLNCSTMFDNVEQIFGYLNKICNFVEE